MSVFCMERSDWSGTDQSGRGDLQSRQKEPSDWSGKRSVLNGGEPSNQNALSGQFQTKQSSQFTVDVFNRSVVARGDAGLPASICILV